MAILLCATFCIAPSIAADSNNIGRFLLTRGNASTAAATAVHAASASAQVVNGFVVGLTLTDGGFGYTSAPTVSITGGGFGAVAVAHVANGVVTGFTILSAGYGYTATPTVQISEPDAPLKLRLEPTHVQLQIHAVLGYKYVIETSNDQTNWVPLMDPFTATKETMAVEIPLNRIGQFQRIYKAP